MTDVKKTAGIEVKIIGADAKTIQPLVDIFKNLDTSVKNATGTINLFKDALKAIKVPNEMKQITEAFTALKGVKFSNLDQLANGFIKLGGLGNKIPDLKPFATEIKKLENLKVPGLNQFAQGMEKIINIPLSSLALKIGTLVTQLSRLGQIGALPNLGQIGIGLEKIMNTKLSGFNAKVNTLEMGLRRLSVIDLRDVATSLRAVATISLAKAAKQTKDMGESVRKLGDSAQASGLQLRSFSDKVRTVFQFRAISEGFMLLKSAISNGITSIIEYSQGLKDLQAITGASDREVSQMGVTILDVASKTKFSASEVAEGMRVIGQAGFTAAESIQTMQAVSDLATGTLSSMSTTVDLVTTAMRVFDIDASRSTEVVDVFANAVNRSKLTVDKLRVSMNFVGPIAKESGVSFKELSAAMGTLANSGIRASTIGTGLRRIFAELVDPSKKLRAAAADAGIALRDLDPRNTSLSTVLSNLKIVLKDTGIAFDIFGKRGAASVLALTSSASQYDEMLNTVSRTGTAAEQASKQMEGLAISFKNLRDKLGVLAVTLGKSGIQSAFKAIVDSARFVVDIFIAMAGTPIGGLITKLGILVVSVGALSTAFLALKGIVATQFFVSMTAGFNALIPVIGGAITALNTFLVALGPIGAVIAALSIALMFTLGNSTKELSGDLLNLADSFGSLSKKVKDYKLSVVGLGKDSAEYKEKTKGLRAQLVEVAEGYGKASKEAAAAAAAIDPLNGAITDGGKALDEYNTALNKLEFDALIKAANLSNDALKDSVSVWSAGLNKIKDAFKEASISMGVGFDVGNSFFEQSEKAQKLSESLRNGAAGFIELDKHVRTLDRNSKNLSSTNKELIARYDEIMETASAAFINLEKSGKVDVRDTVEGFTKMAESLEYSGPLLDALVKKFQLFQKLNESKASNIIEKWSKDLNSLNYESLGEFIDKNRELVGVLTEQEEAQIRSSEARRKELTKDLEAAKALLAEQLKSAKGDDRIAAVKSYLLKERNLLSEASKLTASSAKNISEQKIRALKAELEDAKKLREQAAIDYEGRDLLLERRREEIARASNKRILEIQSGMISEAPSYKEQLAVYKENLQERETLLAKHVNAISLLEASGAISSEQADASKMAASLKFYEQSYRNAIKFRDKIDKLEDPENYGKANKQALAAEEKFYAEKTKYLIDYTKEAKKNQDEIIDIDKKINEEIEKNSNKRETSKEKLSAKLLSIEQTYAQKVESIQKALADKLKAIDEKIADNRSSTKNDILSLESSTEEKIRQVRKKSMTDEQKDISDRLAAYKYLREGQLLIAEAEKEKDSEKLARGVVLVRQSESLASGLKSETNSVNLLKSTLKSLKNARDIEGELKELDLVKEKNKEIADAEAKQTEAKTIYDNKVSAAKTANASIMKLENERHATEMNNLNTELSKYLEKLVYVYKILDATGKSNHTEEISRIKSEIQLLGEKYNIITASSKEAEQKTIDGYRVIEENGVKTFTNIINKASDFSTIKKNGVEAFATIAQKAKDSTETIIAGMDENGIRTFTNVAESFDGSFVQVFDKISDSSNRAFGSIKKDAELSLSDISSIIDGNFMGFDAIEAQGVKAFTSIDDTAKQISDTNIEITPTVETEDVSNFKVLFDSLTDKIITLTVKIIGYDKLIDLKDLFDSIKDKTVTFKTKFVTEGSAPTNVTGFAKGGRLPGFGGGDRRPVLAEDGEWWINKFAVKKYGDSFLSAINNMSLPRFQLGGKVGASNLDSSSINNNNPSLQNFGRVVLDTGNMQIPAIMNQDVVSQLTAHLNNIKRFRT